MDKCKLCKPPGTRTATRLASLKVGVWPVMDTPATVVVAEVEEHALQIVIPVMLEMRTVLIVPRDTT